MKAEPGAIIFDFNGVIVDDEPLHKELFCRVLAEEGIVLTDDEYHKSYPGYADRGAFQKALRENAQEAKAGSDDYLRELIDRKAEYYLTAVSEQSLLFPGIVDLVREAAKRYPLAIASGALRSEIELILQRGEIRDCFRVIIAAEDVSVGKPDPESYQSALAGLNRTMTDQRQIEPSECLVIEDSLAGIEAAVRAGMRVLAVTSSFRAEELTAADLVVPDLRGFRPVDVWAKIAV